MKGDALTALSTTDLSETTLLTNLSLGNRMVYQYTPLGVYFSNGVITGRYVNGAVRGWGVEHANRPVLSQTANGGLDAGTYQVAITYTFADGEEGGTTTAAAITISSGGGIQAAVIPQPASLDVASIELYVSATNGAVLYHYGSYAVGTTTVIINRSTTLGRELSTQFLYPMPAGNVIEEFNGRLYIAVGNLVWFSEPFRYGQRKADSFMMFPDTVSILSRAANGGLHVVADQHYYLAGGAPADFSMSAILDHRGVRGTLVKLPDGITRAWVTDKGMVTSSGSGQLEVQLRDTLFIDEATEGAALYTERDGETFIVASLRDGQQSVAVAGDFVDAEVIRRS